MADTIAPVSLTPGTRLGAYEIEKLVGHGGFGYLYRVARDGRSYALKISRERPADLDDEFRADWLGRLDREVAALKTLNHPNIVRVHSFDWYPTLHNGYPYIVMDLVEGVTLTEWRRRASRSLREVVALMAGVADALGHIHAHGLIHRDLKPANIMVREDNGAPVVVDFGIARAEHADGITAAGWSIGTISFFAPEYAGFLLSDESADGGAFEWTSATDLHSVGYILYELLTGRGPFPAPKQDGGDTAVYQTIRTFVPPLPSVRTDGLVPESLDAVVMKLLAKTPTDRYRTAEEAGQALRALLANAGPEWDRGLPSPAKTRPPPVAVRTNVVPKVAPAPAEASSAPPAAATPKYAPATLEASPEREAAPARPSDAGSASAEPAAFQPPSVVRPRMTEVGRAKPKAEVEKEEALPVMATEVRRSLEQLEPQKRAMARGTKLILAGAAVIAVLFSVLFIGAAMQPQEAHKIDLLKSVERRQREEAAQERLRQESATKPVKEEEVRPVSLAEDAAPPPPAPSPAPAAAPGTPPPPSAKPLSAPEAEIAAADAARGRPQAAPPVSRRPGTAPVFRQSAPVEEAATFQRSTRVGGTTKAIKSDKIGVPLGAHIRVRLLSNLDSRTLGGAPIEALLPSGYFVSDNMVLPPRTVLYGTASANGGRFQLAFHRLRLPDNSEAAFEAVGMDLGDGKPGLRAGRSIVPDKVEGPGLGSRVARNAAGTAVALAPLGGGLGTSIAKGAASDTVAGVGQGSVEESSSERAILLDAPLVFDLFVTKAF